MIEATEKQINYASDIASELGIDLPESHSMKAICEFIDDNKNDFYKSRRERMGGYTEMQDRMERNFRERETLLE